MTTSSLYRMSGITLVIAALLTVVSNIALTLFFPNSGPTVPPSDVMSPLWSPIGIIGFVGGVLLLFGLVGLYLRQAKLAGIMGLLGFLLMFLGVLFASIVAGFFFISVLPYLAAKGSSAIEEGFSMVALTFERFWPLVVQGQVMCETETSVLACLRASLHGAILETLRNSSRPRAVSNPRPGMEDRPDRSEIWDRLQALLPNQREQRLAYLLFHCGLSPREIARCCREEWNDVQEISRLRHTFVERLLRNVNQLTLTAHSMGGEMG